MGLIRIRDKHVRLAMDNDSYDAVKDLLQGSKTPSIIIERCIDEANRLDLRITTKTSTSKTWSKMTTTFYKEIRLGTGFALQPEWAQAMIWAHEMVHGNQWRKMGRATFGTRYLDTRWRWIIEMQAYRMSIHIRERIGIPQAATVTYIQQKPNDLWDAYAFWALNKWDFTKYTREVLSTELK